MKSLKKDRIRKIWGLSEPAMPADPEVVGRRHYHMTAAKWLSMWSYPLQAIFALCGFVVVLLPMFSTSWRALIESTPVAGRVFHDFSSLSGWSMLLLFVLIVLSGILDWRVGDYPGGWHPTKQWGFPSPKQVVELELYPNTRREEFIFWLDIAFGAIGTSIWMIFCGVFAFFMKIGA